MLPSFFTKYNPMPKNEHDVSFFRDTEEGSVEFTIHFRLIQPEDEQRLMAFFHSHTEETIYSRYGMMVRDMSPPRAMKLVQLDGHKQLAIIGLDGHADVARIVAIGRYALDPTTNLAEVAFVVHEQYRGVGIAKHLLRHLAELIRINGFSGITAQTLSSNRPMLQVLNDVLGRAETTCGCGETTLVYRFKKAPHIF
jgi:GNAT superfamily N-acetyltransferase